MAQTEKDRNAYKLRWDKARPKGVCLDCGDEIYHRSTRCRRCAAGRAHRRNGKFA